MEDNRLALTFLIQAQGRHQQRGGGRPLEREVSTWLQFKHIIHLPCWKDADTEAKMDTLFKSFSPSSGEGEEGLEDKDVAPRIKSKNTFKAKKGVITRPNKRRCSTMSNDRQDDRTSIHTVRYNFPIHCHLITNLTCGLFNALSVVVSSQPPG